MASTFTVVFDACVLHPFYSRDLLVDLSMTDTFRGRWSAHIHAEWMESVRRRRPEIDQRTLDEIRRRMDGAVLDCLVTGYEDLIGGIELPDPKDAHVVAAAVRAGADAIVTHNLRHFPEASLRAYGLTAQSPDDFLLHLLGLHPAAVLGSVRRVRGHYRRPALDPTEYLGVLERLGFARSAQALARYIAHI